MERRRGVRGPVLEEIRVYPLKGAAGVSVDAWEVDSFGPRLDRRWMVVDREVGRHVTQRDHPRLALVGPSLDQEDLVLTAPEMEPLRLPRSPGPGPRRQVTVWDSRCRVRDLGPEPAEWMSDFLGSAVQVVFMPPDTVRPVAAHPSARVSFADGYPFLLLSREALEELNRRLDEPVPMDRFRPNLVVRGCDAPHAEDRWRRIGIGELEFRVVKPCPRCTVTTVDQETGRRSPEPLRTLALYRRDGGRVWFGQNLVHQGTGILERGRSVRVLEDGEARPGLP